MNFGIIRYILGLVVDLEGVLLLFPGLVAYLYHEKEGYSFLLVSIVCLILGTISIIKKPKDREFYSKEGFVVVALSWVVLSIFGALPMYLCGDIEQYIDALFETVSGFTTTGASIADNVEMFSHATNFWRCFTHWIGGMGVLVFILAIITPSNGGYSMHLMKAESPGPSVSKIVPRIKDTAKILYKIYFFMTLAQMVCLLMAGMPLFDAICTAVGTAGTGGFGIKADSMASYNAAIQIIVTVFMILFGVNFNAYYILLKAKEKKAAFEIEEVRVYFLIIFMSIALITINICNDVKNIGYTIRHTAFQVGSIITTTGFATKDFNTWPQLSRAILVLIMFVGACAGSTGGGMKVSRLIILIKSAKREISYFIHPRCIKTIKMDGKTVEKEQVRDVHAFFVTYVMIFVGSVLIVSLDNFDAVTNFTSVAATFNNIGPGLNVVGPTGNFAQFSVLSKIVLMLDMLAGRLEIYPMLLLFMPKAWTRN
ncbi:TrkH family potassium uptake protein [Lachnobacterium bovis]|uniref:TrkH family potassium uptake protein n=1 Tax=Lachnobacterium bovis TaxID=140626 RepID=UPI0003B49B58|nr:TrkH family potassium uptake protein [Lachnobacterium bovis]